MAIGASQEEILSEKLPLDLVSVRVCVCGCACACACACVCVCVCVCSQMGGVRGRKMGAVSQPNETNLLSAHTHTHTHTERHRASGSAI